MPAKAVEQLLIDADKLSQRRLAIIVGGDCPASAVPPGTGIMPTDAREAEMVWTWRFEKADGTEAVPVVPPEEFRLQGDAVSWIGAEWKPLLDGGVDQVRLFRGRHRVYGPMSLHAAE